ncbi:hypothetical protein [Sulfuricaulis limicola]|uniref:hypothetical protein n=1 Tax=Sulfuricaulis limicola TaxID=1620215 RepID=UPI0011E4CA29|nr:hypothetical protein [Sulfuricaulis limicola]
MNHEFQKTGLNTVTSSQGFTVEVKFAGGVHYHDAIGDILIDSEWLVNPPRILLYRRRAYVSDSRLNDVYANAQRALEYLGHRVETWTD